MYSGGTIGTAYGETIPVNPSMQMAGPAASPTPTATGAGASSGMSGAMAGGTAISAGAAMAGIVSSICGYYANKTTMESQAELQTMALDHQDAMAKIDKDMKMNVMQSEIDRQNAAVSGNKEYLKSAEKLKKAQDNLAVVKAQVKEAKATKKAEAESTAKVDKLFRNGYGYGNPF